jgi:hypothetical protein
MPNTAPITTDRTKQVGVDYLAAYYPDCLEAIREAMADAFGVEGDVSIESATILAKLNPPQLYWYGYDDQGNVFGLGPEEIGIREAAAVFESVQPLHKMIELKLEEKRPDTIDS